MGPARNERQRRLRARALPLGLIALAAAIGGAYVGANASSKKVGERFVSDWAKRDYEAMYGSLSSQAKDEYSEDEFTEAYRLAKVAAGISEIDPGAASTSPGGAVKVEVGVITRFFDRINGQIEMPLTDGGIDWSPSMTFPGLRPDERVARSLELGRRGSILAADGTPLAQGSDLTRSSPLGSAAIDVTGTVEEPDEELRPKVESSGYPGDQPTGVGGLEQAFNPTLAGKPGGKLLAVSEGTDLPDVPASTKGRVLATAMPTDGKDVETTVDPDLQEATVSALAGAPGGAIVLDVRTGEVKGLAGLAYSEPGPPGSSFKTVTATAALREGELKLDDYYTPAATIQTAGREFKNAYDKVCGGDITQSFAESCNTVFAPLGVEVGGEALIATSEDYGFNKPPTLFNAQAVRLSNAEPSTIPSTMTSETEVAETAIGQGRVLATPLIMATVSQTIAAGGLRRPTPIVASKQLRSRAKPTRVMSREDARVMTSLMTAVVAGGTGSLAAISGAQVAGKTGTAQLGIGKGVNEIVDAWFTAFAPADKPRYAVAVLIAGSSRDGGAAAAPVAGQILAAALD